MKVTYLCILILIFFLPEQTAAQVLLNTDTLNLELKTPQNFTPDFKNLFNQRFDNKIVMNLSGTIPKAKLFSSNEKFAIYTLPIDNMPCLVPNKLFKGNMETMEQTFKNNEQVLNGKIPNIFNKKNLIPKNNQTE